MSDCVLWDGKVMNTGYGLIRRRLAHRVVYEKAHGMIPFGKQIHHICGVRLCVNPEHLVAVTPQEHNALHGYENVWGADRRRAVTHCPQGHEYTPENTKIKQGKRHCRACMRAYSKAYHEANREYLLPLMRERSKRLREARS